MSGFEILAAQTRLANQGLLSMHAKTDYHSQKAICENHEDIAQEANCEPTMTEASINMLQKAST